ncbi:MAG: hypothetical protein GXX80_10915 [Thermotogaceae bacterium]|nr:hypothetical protein [Thermotogaceae bacterium]
MKSIKDLKGVFEAREVFKMEITGKKVEIPVKSLAVNFQDELDEQFPYPEAPKKPNKKTHKFEPDYEDQGYLKDCEAIDRIRIYATVAMAIDGKIKVDGEEYAIEGEPYEMIDSIMDTKIPLGYWTKLAERIQEISGIDEDSFRKGEGETRKRRKA